MIRPVRWNIPCQMKLKGRYAQCCKILTYVLTNNIIPACNFDFDSCQQCYSQKDFDQVIDRKFNLLSISELTSNAEGIVSFIRGSNELLDDIAELGIKVGCNLKYEYNDNRMGNHYLVTIDENELNVPIEMANNIFIRI